MGNSNSGNSKSASGGSDSEDLQTKETKKRANELRLDGISSPVRRAINEVKRIKIEPGATVHKVTESGWGYHAAIYIGSDNVVDVSDEGEIVQDGQIWYGPIKPDVADLTAKYSKVSEPLVPRGVSRFSLEETKKRAIKVAKGSFKWNYHNTENNCEDFTNWLSTGYYGNRCREDERGLDVLNDVHVGVKKLGNVFLPVFDDKQGFLGATSVQVTKDDTINGRPRWIGPKPTF